MRWSRSTQSGERPQAGRLPHARSLPLADLPDRVDEIPRCGALLRLPARSAAPRVSLER